jgi:SAM-dependent methyltransferase
MSCPACLEPGILADVAPEAFEIACRRCHRSFPVDRFGIVDFQVHDRLARLPDGALEVRALAEAASAANRAAVSSLADPGHEAIGAFGRFLDIDGQNAVEIAFGLDEIPRYLEDLTPARYVAVDPEPSSRPVPFTKVQAWAELMPFANETFDAAISVMSLDRVLCLDSALRELHRVLRPDAVVYLWLPLLAAAKWCRPVFPPLFTRGADAIPDNDGRQRRAAALESIWRRLDDTDRLKSRYGHLLAGACGHLRHLPLNFLKQTPRYGFRPELVDVWDRSRHDGRPFLNAFVRLRKSGPRCPIDPPVVHHVNRLAESATLSEELLLVSQELRSVSLALDRHEQRAAARLETYREELVKQLADLRADITSGLHADLNELRQAVDCPRTPLERVYRRLSSWWHRDSGGDGR